MKKVMLSIIALSSLLLSQDAAGNYRLTGLDVQYTNISRATVPIVVSTDQLDNPNTEAVETFSTVLDTLSPGQVYLTGEALRSGPYNEEGLSNLGVNLNVLLYEDGSGAIPDNSSYPDVELIPGTCITDVQVLPVTDDEMVYSSDHGANLTKTGVNTIGMPALGAGYHGQSGYGGLGLQQSVVFDYFPEVPYNPTLCDDDGNCFDVILPGFTQEGGNPLAGLNAGYWKSETLGDDLGSSIVPGNIDPEFYLEWHVIDGPAVESGMGDVIGSDEDGDGTDFDRIFGLPAITVAYLNNTPECGGFSQPIFGGQAVIDGITANVVGTCIETVLSDEVAAGCAYAGVYATLLNMCLELGADQATCEAVAAGLDAASGGDCATAIAIASSTGEGTLCDTAGNIFQGMCLPEVSVGADNVGYVMDPTGALATWGNFLTGNAVQFGGCLQQGGDAATCFALYGADDSEYDFPGTDGSGRLTMNFEPTCVPTIEVREVYAEFVNYAGDCDLGDPSGDGLINVLDVVALVQMTDVGTDECICAADMNEDGICNVLDIVAVVNIIFGGRIDDNATSAEFKVSNNQIEMSSNGWVGAVQMTIEHGENFELTLTENTLVNPVKSTEGNQTTILFVMPKSDDVLLSANSHFTIESVVAAANSESYMETSVSYPSAFSVAPAYPNPFNPVTNINLSLNTDADVSVKIYNMMGQLIDIIADGQMSNGSYSFSWDATDVSSGLYFIKTTVGSDVKQQKVMLLK